MLSQLNNQLSVTDKNDLSPTDLARMRDGGTEVLEAYRALQKVTLNVVGECMKNQGDFIQFNHYPDGDVYDNESHAQFYYHAHRGVEGEHGHFHTFLRQPGMPENMASVQNNGDVEWPSGNDAVSHIIAISMDKYGYPIGLFAVNRWVTGETWYPAESVKQMIDRFEIDHAWPNWAVNRWITGMFRLFRPEIIRLIDGRDQVVKQWRENKADIDTFEDRDLEITGWIDISVERQIDAVDAALAS